LPPGVETQEVAMKDRTNDQKGAQQHAEGEYGDQARERNREQLQDGEDRDPASSEPPDRLGKHRIYEDRQQHDEADKNSEKNRLERNRDAGRTG
jgi:hypothetical protein